MTISIDSIDDFHYEKIEILKERLGKGILEETPLFSDDFSLLRWLVGWNYNIGIIFIKNIRIL